MNIETLARRLALDPNDEDAQVKMFRQLMRQGHGNFAHQIHKPQRMELSFQFTDLVTDLAMVDVGEGLGDKRYEWKRGCEPQEFTTNNPTAHILWCLRYGVVDQSKVKGRGRLIQCEIVEKHIFYAQYKYHNFVTRQERFSFSSHPEFVKKYQRFVNGYESKFEDGKAFRKQPVLHSYLSLSHEFEMMWEETK